jgi:hypothetical protein
VLFLTGRADGENRDFSVAVGKAAQQKYGFSAGMTVSGMAQPVADRRIEIAEFYKVSGIKVTGDGPPSIISGPPFIGVPPDLDTYLSRDTGGSTPGHTNPAAFAASGGAGCRWK